MDKPRLPKWRISMLAVLAVMLWFCVGLALIRAGLSSGGKALVLCSFYGGAAIASALAGLVAILCGRHPSVGIILVLAVSAVIGTLITLSVLPP